MICMSYRIKARVRLPESSQLARYEGVEIPSKKSESKIIRSIQDYSDNRLL